MSPDLEWRVDDPSGEQTIAKTTPPRPPRWRTWVIGLVVMLGVGLGVIYRTIPEPLPRPTPTPLPPTPTPLAVPAKLYAAIDREAQALADGDIDSYLAVSMPRDTSDQVQLRNGLTAWGRPTDRQPYYEIIDYNLRTQTKAWADIRQYRNGRWFRATRFYQRQGERWLRSEPDPFFWSGQVETLDTLHFHVIYASEDRELIPPTISRLEEAYPQVCRNLGCVDDTSDLTYTLKLNGTSRTSLRLSDDAREIILSSPRLTGVFEDAPLDNNVLLWGVAAAATQRVYYGAATQWSGDSVGHIVFGSIIDWAAERSKGEPSDAHMLIGSLAAQPLAPLVDLWGAVHEFDQKQQTWVERGIPDSTYMEAHVIIYFIEQAYGKQSMPRLLKALGTAHSFADVIETGLGVPFAEFDQKWQTWLKQNGRTAP